MFRPLLKEEESTDFLKTVWLWALLLMNRCCAVSGRGIVAPQVALAIAQKEHAGCSLLFSFVGRLPVSSIAIVVNPLGVQISSI